MRESVWQQLYQKRERVGREVVCRIACWEKYSIV